MQNMRNKIIVIVLVVVNILFAVNLVKSFASYRNRKITLSQTENNLLEEQNRKLDLERELVQTENIDYIEEQARKKLNMAKEDELVILMPTLPVQDQITPTPTPRLSNVEKWIEVFWK